MSTNKNCLKSMCFKLQHKKKEESLKDQKEESEAISEFTFGKKSSKEPVERRFAEAWENI